MLTGIGIETPEDVGSGVLLEPDGGDEAQKGVPVLADPSLIDSFIRADDPVSARESIWFKYIEGLLPYALDTRGEGKTQQVGYPEDGFSVTVAVGGMDVAFDDIVAHEAINNIGALTISRADHQRMPENVAFIDERIGADTLALAEILEGPACVQAFAAHLEFLAIAGGVQYPVIFAIDVWQFHLVHGLYHGIVGGADIIERKPPVNSMFKFAFSDA